MRPSSTERDGEGSCCGPAFQVTIGHVRCGPASEGPGWRSLGPGSGQVAGWTVQPGRPTCRTPSNGSVLVTLELAEHFHLSFTTNRRDRAV